MQVEPRLQTLKMTSKFYFQKGLLDKEWSETSNENAITKTFKSY